jgi:hypothetical protein
MLKELNTGASRKTTLSSKNALVGKGKKLNMLKKMAVGISKTLMPIVMNMAMKKLTGSGTKTMTFEELKRRSDNPSLMDSLSRKLASGAFRFLKAAIMGKMKGKGMAGAGFFKSFLKTIKKAVKKIAPVAKKALPVAMKLAPLLL